MSEGPSTSRTWQAALVLAVLIGAAYGGYRYWQAHQPYEWSGTVEARTIDVGSRAGGRVKEVLVTEGDRVKAGQPLIILEPSDLQAQLLANQGALDQAKANLDKLQHGARPEEIDQAIARSMMAKAAYDESKVGARKEEIDAAVATLEASNVAVEKAQLDWGRTQKLFASGAASQADYDNAQINLKAVTATRDARREQVNELKNGTRREDLDQAKNRAGEAEASRKLVLAGARIEDIEAAKGQVEAAQGRMDSVKTMLEELVIRAPLAALVESSELRPGDILPPNATAAKLVEDDQLYVRIYIPETELGHVKVGDHVPVTVDAFKDRSFKGVVEHINMIGEYSPRNLQTADERADQVFATRIGLQEGRDLLRAGMAAFIQVPK